jgi:hypothetical protein
MLKNSINLMPTMPLSPSINLLINLLHNASPKARRRWSGLSLAFCLVYGLLGLQQAFAGDYIVQDDARQHVFWMQRFLDPELFPQDLIADYFQAVAPQGYRLVYWLPAQLGLDPFLLNKLLPPLIALVTTWLGFAFFMALLPIPAVGFVATALLNQNLSMRDDIISATPRAFAYPLIMGFCYFLVCQRPRGVALMLLLLGLFYPQGVILGVGLLLFRLIHWQGWRPRLSRQRADWQLALLGLLTAGIAFIPFLFSSSGYGPTITGAEASTMPEFLQFGRSKFFYPPFPGYLWEGRGEILPKLTPATLYLCLLLPIFSRYRRWFPLVAALNRKSQILLQIVLVSLGCYAMAYGFLFKLHLPSRYTTVTLRYPITFAAALVGMSLVEVLLRWGINHAKVSPLRTGIGRLGAGGLVVLLVAYPLLFRQIPYTLYVQGKAPGLYQFLRQTPKSTLVASLEWEADNLPTFAQRSVLATPEYAIPYHLGYYRLFRQRVLDTIRAQYSPDLPVLQQVIKTYGVDYWLVHEDAFTPNFLQNMWIRQYPQAVAAAQADLQQGQPALQRHLALCTIWQGKGLHLVASQCLSELSNQAPE